MVQFIRLVKGRYRDHMIVSRFTDHKFIRFPSGFKSTYASRTLLARMGFYWKYL